MDDYIKRADVKKLLWERISLATFMRRGIPNAMKSLSLISEELEKIPAADVRPVDRGHWIIHRSDIFPADSTMECDQCHEEQPLTCDDNFCPNCGAKMGGVNRGTD